MKLESKDGTQKFIFDLGDGKVETVILFLVNKVTLCISTQIGCKMKCDFCRTGKLGFKRNLTTEEIVMQYTEAKKQLDQDITAIVFMGMGEPLDNYDNLVKAIHILNQEHRYSMKKMTVSTSGIPERMIQLFKETSVKLALSLNATDNKTRDKLMPINKKYPIETLVAAIKSLPRVNHRPIMIEYVLLKDINDTNVEKIADMFEGCNLTVNLIPYNCHDKSNYQPTDLETIQKIKQKLRDKGVKTFIRENKGNDINAACGTLG